MVRCHCELTASLRDSPHARASPIIQPVFCVVLDQIHHVNWMERDWSVSTGACAHSSQVSPIAVNTLAEVRRGFGDATGSMLSRTSSGSSKYAEDLKACPMTMHVLGRTRLE